MSNPISGVAATALPPRGSRPWFDTFSRTAPVNSNCGLDLLRQIMNFAIARGHADANPTVDIQPKRRPELTRFLSRKEIARLHRALDGQAGRCEPETTQEMMLRLTGIDITVCRQCGDGTGRERVRRGPTTPAWNRPDPFP